jgi:uncharacterized protein YlxP (DUF503 family)
MFLTTQPHSLKEKRAIVNKLKDAVRNRLSISVAEVDAQDKWQRAVLGVACVTAEQQSAHRLLEEAARVLNSYPEVQVLEEERDVDAW